jgi:hypothetical protein
LLSSDLSSNEYAEIAARYQFESFDHLPIAEERCSFAQQEQNKENRPSQSSWLE